LDEGAAYVFGAPLGPHAAEISLEHPAGTPLSAGTSTVSFGGALLGSSVSRTFFIESLGNIDLTGIVASIDGPGSGDFAVTGAPSGSVAFGGKTSLVISFTPTTSGTRNAMLHLASNDADENPFDVTLTGVGVVSGDTDGDGLSDLAEVNIHGTNPALADTDGDLVSDGTEVDLAALGFDPLADSTALRALLHSKSLGLGLYRTSDVQNLALGQPLLERNGSTGKFTLRIGLERSPDLRAWSPLMGFTPTYNATTGEVFLEFAPAATGAEFYRVFGSKP